MAFLRRAGFYSRPFFCTLLLAGCGEPAKPLHLLDAAHSASWRAAGIADEGKVIIEKNEITLHSGAPITGARFEAWKPPAFPSTRYAIDYEAMRVEGGDFFGTVTFPVGEAHLSFVMGGWGGTLVGLSSIDHRDASENETRGDLAFENGRWYRVRIEVREDDIRAWIDQKPFVNVNIRGRRLELRAGGIEKCAPFGFASYLSTARVRGVTITRL
ncbi:MAG: hypothetical protein JNG86_22340 [Verrucomicrobiaceae bacterium]|nr:hypothetical protein [Verrucomicrobiaceae bacterium]